MPKLSDMTVEVTAKLSVGDDTARRCMALLAMWLDDNPHKRIVVERVETGDGFRHRVGLEGECGSDWA